jgi:hypothetical protein
VSEIEVVRHPRARRASLKVDAVTGATRLVLPPRAALAPALAWARANRAWIADQQARLPEARPFGDGATIPFEDDEVTIAWCAARPRRVEREGDRLVLGGPASTIARRIEAWLRARALDRLVEDTAFYADRAGVSVDKVTIGDPRGRWGSCAASGAIRYSWRLICAPVAVRRATAAHEVAHRVHMNHAPAFHALVATLFGADPSPQRRWLRDHGAMLHRLGRGLGEGVGSTGSDA